VSFGQVAGWIGAVTYLGRLTPQAVRLARTRNAAGVSWLGAANQVAASVGWAIYGLGVGEAVLWLPGAIAIAPAAATVWFAGPRPPRVRDGVVAAVWIVAVVVAWPLGGRVALAAVIGVDVVATNVPHVLAAARSRDLSGIAPTTWRVAVADAVLWGIYSIGERDPMTALYSIVLGSSALFILRRCATAGAATRREA
jgi:uncharacterized protein with PQ loop repeat